MIDQGRRTKDSAEGAPDAAPQHSSFKIQNSKFIFHSSAPTGQNIPAQGNALGFQSAKYPALARRGALPKLSSLHLECGDRLKWSVHPKTGRASTAGARPLIASGVRKPMHSQRPPMAPPRSRSDIYARDALLSAYGHFTTPCKPWLIAYTLAPFCGTGSVLLLPQYLNYLYRHQR